MFLPRLLVEEVWQKGFGRMALQRRVGRRSSVERVRQEGFGRKASQDGVWQEGFLEGFPRGVPQGRVLEGLLGETSRRSLQEASPRKASLGTSPQETFGRRRLVEDRSRRSLYEALLEGGSTNRFQISLLGGFPRKWLVRSCCSGQHLGELWQRYSGTVNTTK